MTQLIEIFEGLTIRVYESEYIGDTNYFINTDDTIGGLLIVTGNLDKFKRELEHYQQNLPKVREPSLDNPFWKHLLDKQAERNAKAMEMAESFQKLINGEAP